MNLKTTLALLVLAAAGILLLWYNPTVPPRLDPIPQPPAVADAGTRETLARITPEKITRIEVQRADGTTVLQRKQGGDWQLPGSWSPRAHEVNELVNLLGNLRSRFEPEPIASDADLSRFGQAPPALTVVVATSAEQHTLALGVGKSGDNPNPFAQPTYLRLDEKPEVVQLAPGLVRLLDRPTDYYQQRRLFPTEQVTREGDKKVEEAAARSITVHEEPARDKSASPGEASEEKKTPIDFTVVHEKDGWKLSQPVSDRLDPTSRDALVAAVPDVWAERFVSISPAGVGALLTPPPDSVCGIAAAFWLTRQGQHLQMGLVHPERTLTIQTESGDTITLRIGGQAVPHERKVTMPPMQGMPPGMPPQTRTVFDQYRYAMLADNEQIFEVRDDKLKDVFVALDTLRDPQVARFNSSDAQRVKIEHGGETIVLARDKEQWRLVEPFAADADRDKVNDLLSKLSGLQARGKDVLDGADPKSYGLDRPDTVITVTVEEEKKTGETKTKETRTVTVRLGKHDKKDKKLYVQTAGWPRINAVEDSLAPLAIRPALAYRGKRVLDFKRDEVARIDVQEGKESFALLHKNDTWRLAEPFDADADPLKSDRLADKLGKLEASEYVDETPKANQLGPKYGLEKPAAVIKVHFSVAGKPVQTLRIGKERAGKGDRFAQVEGKAGQPAPVFVVANDLYQDLAGGALAYRPQQLWQLFADRIAAVRIHKEGQDEYRLSPEGNEWKISGPFEARALAATAKKMVDDLVEPRCERYVTNSARDLAEYGLDRPFLSVTLTDKKGTEHTLELGKPANEQTGQRYARVGKSKTVVEVGGNLVRTLDRTALSLLDPVLLQLDAKKLERLHSATGKERLTLDHKDGRWQVAESPAGVFELDSAAIGDVELVWVNLVADRFEAYGNKVAWDKYGLDRPAYTVTVKADGEHVVQLGKPVEGTPGARYARVDRGPGVAVLPAHEAEPLARTYLDYVNRTLLIVPADAVAGLQRSMGDEVLQVEKKDEGWQVVKPTEEQADEPTLQDLLTKLGELRAQRIVAYPVKDLAKYGLDRPEARWALRLREGKPAEHVVKVGKAADEKTGERFVQVDDGKAVAVLPGPLSQRLTAAPLAFRDRTLAQFADADRLQLERGRRKAVFSRVEGNWKLTEPLSAEAGQNELDDFLNSLAKLRADELVRDKADAATLKKYGLDRPALTWRVQLGDKELLQLVVGSADRSGRRRYARLAGRDLVFLLDPQLSSRVLAEYRSRTVWKTPLDAAQVESVRYGYSDRKSFALERSGNSWTVSGKPQTKINTEAVNDTLSALAELKLLRYVVDQGADRKLYGLHSPYLTLEVVSPSGKHTLLLGHTEGQSKRSYACLDDPDRSDVFLLDEQACDRIIRDLAAFGRPPAGAAGAAPFPPVPMQP